MRYPITWTLPFSHVVAVGTDDLKCLPGPWSFTLYSKTEIKRWRTVSSCVWVKQLEGGEFVPLSWLLAALCPLCFSVGYVHFTAITNIADSVLAYCDFPSGLSLPPFVFLTITSPEQLETFNIWKEQVNVNSNFISHVKIYKTNTWICVIF